MDAKKYFLSEENSRNLSKQLFDHLEVDDSKEKRKIHEALKKVMLGIWEKNKDKAEKHSTETLIPHLNKKSIQYVLSGGVKQSKGQAASGKSVGQMQMDREREAVGERRVRYQEQPESNIRQTRQRQREDPEIMESDAMGGRMGGMSYAPFSSKMSGEVIRADGHVGSHFQRDINQNEYIDKGRSKKEMNDISEQKFASLEQERRTQSDYNPYMKQPPKEINFRLDGTDSRQKDEYADNGKGLEPINGMDMRSTGENSQMQQMQLQQFQQMQQMLMQQQQLPQQQTQIQDPRISQQMYQSPPQQPEMQASAALGQASAALGQNEQMMFMIQQVIQQMLSAGNSEINNYSNIRNSLKTSIANKLDMDMNPQALKDMSVDEISKFLAKKKKKFRQDSRSEQSRREDSSDDDVKSDESDEKYTKKDVKKFIKTKKETIEKQKGLEKFVNGQIKKKNKKVDTESESDSDRDIKKKTKSRETDSDSDSNSKKKKKKKPVETESDTDSDDDRKKRKRTKTKKDKKRKESDSESEDEKEEEKPIPKISSKSGKSTSQPTVTQAPSSSQGAPPPILEIVKTRIVKNVPKAVVDLPVVPSTSLREAQGSIPKEAESRTIVVKCNEIEPNPEYYNDYLVLFKERYDKLIDDKYIKANKIMLEKVDINLTPKITEKTNMFKIFLNDVRVETVLKEGNYSLSNIIKAIDHNLESEGIAVENNNGFITVRNKDDKQFDIDCTDNSIVKLLGFTEEKYSGAFKYTGERRHAFNEEPIYLYVIDDVDDGEKKPFAKINPDGTFKQLVFEFKKKDIELLVIQFSTKETNNWDKNDLVNLGGEPHSLTFKFT